VSESPPNRSIPRPAQKRDSRPRPRSWKSLNELQSPTTVKSWRRLLSKPSLSAARGCRRPAQQIQTLPAPVDLPTSTLKRHHRLWRSQDSRRGQFSRRSRPDALHPGPQRRRQIRLPAHPAGLPQARFRLRPRRRQDIGRAWMSVVCRKSASTSPWSSRTARSSIRSRSGKYRLSPARKGRPAEDQIQQLVTAPRPGRSQRNREMLPSSLSTGQKRCIAIARALAAQPEAILYDEPTTMVDPIMGAHRRSHPAAQAPVGHYQHRCHPRHAFRHASCRPGSISRIRDGALLRNPFANSWNAPIRTSSSFFALDAYTCPQFFRGLRNKYGNI
jgi:hypothetical protein